MKRIINYCRNLKTLPDISKWKIDNVIKMDYVFFQCENLIELSEISKWN